MAIDNSTVSRTLYCSNLDSKIKKPDLIRHLYLLFSTFGPVLDVVAVKTAKLRGQAHVVFADEQSSSAALKQLHGFEFFGKQMRVFYARGKSNIITRLEGGVGASLAAADSRQPQSRVLAGSAPAATATAAPAGQVEGGSADKPSIFNAPGGYIKPRPSDGLAIRPPAPAARLAPPPTTAQEPASPARKRSRQEMAEDEPEDPAQPRPSQPLPARTGQSDGSDGSDDDEMEMSDDDE